MREQIIEEAKRVAEKAMSLTTNVAEKHATTYYRQHTPAYITLYEVQAIFREAFAQREEELAELDSYQSEDEE